MRDVEALTNDSERPSIGLSFNLPESWLNSEATRHRRVIRELCRVKWPLKPTAVPLIDGDVIQALGQRACGTLADGSDDA